VKVAASATTNIGAAPNTGISVDAWVAPTTTTQEPVLEWNNGVNPGVHLWVNFPAAGNIYMNVVDTTGANHAVATTNAPVLANGSYQHITWTFDKATGNVAIYYNGAAQPTTVATLGTGFTPQTGAGYDMYLGFRPAPAATYFTGNMDEVETYGRAL